jgi:hypothetical protein
MPTTIDAALNGYAHCLNARCPGYAQEPVRLFGARRRTPTPSSTAPLRAASPASSAHRSAFVFADEDDAACPHCEGPREIAPQPRTTYQNLSGHDPNGLLNLRPGEAPDVGALQAEIAALKQKVGDAA